MITSTAFSANKKPLVLNTYADACAAMKEHKVPGLFIFTAGWCQPCLEMKHETFTPLMPQLRKKYIVYFIDTEKERGVVEKWAKQGRVKSIPAYVIIAPGGKKVIAYDEKYRNKTEFIRWMRDAVNEWNTDKVR